MAHANIEQTALYEASHMGVKDGAINAGGSPTQRSKVRFFSTD